MAGFEVTFNGRFWVTPEDVPAVLQIFGGVVMDAGIEGILYKSAITASGHNWVTIGCATP